jgi:hypothetical protein
MPAIRWTAEQLAAYGGAKRLPDTAMSARPSKHGNRKITTEHGTFDSEKEARRYADLILLERAGKIQNLRRQVRYAIISDGQHICDYIADAVYMEGARTVVEDTKSDHTRRLRVYKMKKALMNACRGISILET